MFLFRNSGTKKIKELTAMISLSPPEIETLIHRETCFFYTRYLKSKYLRKKNHEKILLQRFYLSNPNIIKHLENNLV